MITHRLATQEDIPTLEALVDITIRRSIGPLVDAVSLKLHMANMGVDTQLIDDGTYFILEEDGQIVGSGGWGKRATLFGGDHSTTVDARLLDPATEPARIRAMYTHPDHMRKGIGRMIIGLCEEAARSAGFKKAELFATVAGEPLYKACGYQVIDRQEIRDDQGGIVKGATMAKKLSSH